MTLTKHSKERLRERLGIRSDSERLKIIRRFERDFISFEVDAEGKTSKTIIWKGFYVTGVFAEDDVLVTVIKRNPTMDHFLSKSNPAFKKGKHKYRNRRRNYEATYRRNTGSRK